MARINDAVRRNLRVKFKLGLMGKTITQRGNASLVGAPQHLELAREAVSKSLVLLKNDSGILPIRNGSRVLIAGAGADNMAMQAGGWTITWQGTDTKAADFTNGRTIGRAISDAVRANGGNAVISAEGGFQVKPDVAVVVVGEKPYAEFEGDVPDLAFRMKSGEEELIARLKSQGVRVVVLFLSGRPMFTGKLINQADAFVAAWLPGTQGRGIADVLVAGPNGKPLRDFTGRLPFAWPADARAPIANPLFSVGYGLTYARNSKLGPVNEDARADLSLLSHASNFVVRGKIPAPWRLDIDGAISARAVDISAQEDAKQFIWNRDGAFAINGPAVDLMQQFEAGSALLIDWRIDQPADGAVKLSLGEATLDMRDAVGSKPLGAVLQTRIPLRCFSEAGAKLGAVSAPFRIAAAKGFAMTIRNVRIEEASGDGACPPKAGN
jgi:beta-glucosidase